jgi:hypothetical protein
MSDRTFQLGIKSDFGFRAIIKEKGCDLISIDAYRYYDFIIGSLWPKTFGTLARLPENWTNVITHIGKSLVSYISQSTIMIIIPTCH